MGERGKPCRTPDMQSSTMSIDRRHPIIARVPSRPAARALATVLAFSLIGAACGDSTGRGSRLGGTAGDNAPADTLHVDRIGYDMGDPDAPILVIEFSDFGCPYCARFALDTYPILHREFVMTGKVHWKFVPFVMGTFPNGTEAARAAECAAEQGEHRFWTMHDRLFERQSEWKSTSSPETLFRDLATEIGLDQAKFASCFDEDRVGSRVRRHNQVASSLGVHATPTFFINGTMVRGALPVEQFRMILNDVLSR